MNQQDIFASAQCVIFHPILNEPFDVKAGYLLYLKKLLHFVGLDKRKYTKAQIKFYQDRLCNGAKLHKGNQNILFNSKFCSLIPYDLVAMLGFQTRLIKSERFKQIIDKIVSDFDLKNEQAEFLSKAVDSATGDSVAWKEIFDSKFSSGFKRYLRLIKQNIDFVRNTPYKVFITATMSAGKSTLINALVGDDISRMQNMACTSKIHTIIAKPFNDGVISEYDHDLSLDATRAELLNDNEKNFLDRITVGVYFRGRLSGKRIALLDSPGVNSSENMEHTAITQRIIKSKKYNLLLYVLNATNLSSNDEEIHLETVRKYLGKTKIIFIMNKVDQLITDGENYFETIENQRKFLKSKGFKKPIICPVSSQAAYLAKKSQHTGLSRFEQRDFDTYIDKFECQSMRMYYTQRLSCPSMSSKNMEESLLINSGFSYLEEIIKLYCDGGKEK